MKLNYCVLVLECQDDPVSLVSSLVYECKKASEREVFNHGFGLSNCLGRILLAYSVEMMYSIYRNSILLR